ncbi:ribonuclease HIII [Aeribacillus composti]|uniref:ribonuclease HIII n=1 Tax=Aeribacillus TaxID=1055323 RepID=UPI002E1D1268|nr:ribonuclease HIII [Aeribacillus composti]
MSNIVIKVDHGGIQTLKDFYNPFIIDRTPPGAVFSAKLTNCTITAYKSGKVLFQGSAAQQEANRWEKTAKTAPSQTEDELQQLQQMSVIGSDEAGTGDYFGPITVAAVFVPKEKRKLVQQLGVKDSKALTDKQVFSIANTLIETVPYSLLILRNEKYNQLQKSGMNQGKLKAILHNQAIHHLLKKISPDKPEAVLIDQFAEPDVYFQYLKDRDVPFKDITIFKPKAEHIHISVAAASIIARYAFLKELNSLSNAAGFYLPKGASHTVDEAAAKLIKEKGKNTLGKMAKLHFANTEKALNLLN